MNTVWIVWNPIASGVLYITAPSLLRTNLLSLCDAIASNISEVRCTILQSMGWQNDSFKRALQASEQCGRSFNQRLVKFLFSYQTTPHTTTNRTPSSLFLKREFRTRLDLLRPENVTKMGEKQTAQNN